jgi:hypothetical protein
VANTRGLDEAASKKLLNSSVGTIVKVALHYLQALYYIGRLSAEWSDKILQRCRPVVSHPDHHQRAVCSKLDPNPLFKYGSFGLGLEAICLSAMDSEIIFMQIYIY